MSDTLRDDLVRQTEQLLEPGEIQLNGVVVQTDIPSQDDIRMHELTVKLGDVIASHATDEETFVYSGVGDPEFSLNQHQGRTLDGEEFVWECQQLVRQHTFDVVFYYEASADHEAIVEEIREMGLDVISVEG